MVTIVPVQCWLAWEALGWSVPDLARAAEVSQKTVVRFECGVPLKASTVKVIQSALEKAGVIFIDANDGGPGARLPIEPGQPCDTLTVRKEPVPEPFSQPTVRPHIFPGYYSTKCSR